MIQLSAGGLVFANEIANEPCDTRWYSTTRNGRGSTQILDCQALMITAQHDGRPTFNPQVVGSIPTGPTKLVSIWSEDFAPRQELNVSANGLLMRRVEQRGEVPCRLLLKAS